MPRSMMRVRSSPGSSATRNGYMLDDKERDAGWRFIEHRVEISNLVAELELATREKVDVGVLRRSDIVEASPTTANDRRVRLRLVQESERTKKAILCLNAIAGDADRTIQPRGSNIFCEEDVDIFRGE